MRFLLVAALLGVLAARPAAAVSPADLPEAGGAATVVAVVDGDTVLLADGRQVRLVGIQAPKLPLGRPGFKTWPLADAAKRALEDLLPPDGAVTLAHGGQTIDRHGRVLAHLFRADGVWVQGRMLETGMARVYTFPDNRALAAAMLDRERAARAAGAGIWGHSFYAVRTPEAVDAASEGFQLVEGRVVAAATVGGRVYLNFGADWKTDFTVMIAKADLKAFTAANLDPAAWAGRLVRVRGWVRRWNGPLIEASHPEQIEVLE